MKGKYKKLAIRNTLFFTIEIQTEWKQSNSDKKMF